MFLIKVRGKIEEKVHGCVIVAAIDGFQGAGVFSNIFGFLFWTYESTISNEVLLATNVSI